MKKICKTINLLCAFLCLLMIIRPAGASVDYKKLPHLFISQNAYQDYVFERVIDGDTFIASGLKIRIWGIDAPEKEEQLFEVSKKALELFLEGKPLSCQKINTDWFNRSVMHCYVEDADIGALMVKTGFARDYPKYSEGYYAEEEVFAREGQLGIWEK